LHVFPINIEIQEKITAEGLSSKPLKASQFKTLQQHSSQHRGCFAMPGLLPAAHKAN
jgi:hypothetical protein